MEGTTSRPASSKEEGGPGSTSPPESRTATNSASPEEGLPQNRDDAPEWKASKAVVLVFITICVLTLMVSLDSTSIGVALPTISRSIHSSAVETFWAGTGFLLCSTVFQPNFVSMSIIFGRRPFFIVAVIFFLIGAIVAGVAHDSATLLVGRCIQGVGGGGIMSITEVLIADLIPLRQRGSYYGNMNAMWAIGSVCGPIIGGAFIAAHNWRWIFYINFPFIGVGLPCVLIFINLHSKCAPLGQQLSQIDWLGSVIFVGSMTSFLIPITWGGVMYAWDSWRTLVPLLVGVAGLACFVPYEMYVAGNPTIPIRIFQNVTVAISFVHSAITGLAIWCIVYYLPLYFEAVREYSAIITGVCLFPQTFTIAPAGILAGVAITKTGKYRWPLWLGWVLATTGCGLFCILKVTTSTPGWIFLNLVSGLGLGFLFPAIASALQASVNQNNVPMALALFSFFRSVGQTLGVAIGGVIFQNRMVANLQAYSNLAPRAHQYGADAAALVDIIKSMPDGPDKDDIKQAYVDSLRIVWAVVCALCGVGLLLTVFVKEYSLDVEHVTDQGIRETKEKSETSPEQPN